jgi:hypothetical protein
VEQKEKVQLNGQKYNEERKMKQMLAFQKHILEKHSVLFDMHF